MDKIKCPTYNCEAREFMLLSEKRFPMVVNEKGEIVSQREYSYKCVLCNVIFKSNIGPDSPKKKLLNG